jgi:hypothetical protein
MLTQILANVLSAVVILGVVLQVATVARVGGRIARGRLMRWRGQKPASPARRAPRAPAVARRRRCDYRAALAAARS